MESSCCTRGMGKGLADCLTIWLEGRRRGGGGEGGLKTQREGECQRRRGESSFCPIPPASCILISSRTRTHIRIRICIYICISRFNPRALKPLGSNKLKLSLPFFCFPAFGHPKRISNQKFSHNFTRQKYQS